MTVKQHNINSNLDEKDLKIQALEQENIQLVAKIASQDSVITEILEGILPEIFGMLG